MKIEYFGEQELDFPKIGLVRTGFVREVNEDFAKELIKTGLWRKPKLKKVKEENPKLGLQISGLGKDIDEQIEKTLREEDK